MAVDTKRKRSSMINFSTISTDLLSEPDGTIAQNDRQTLLDLYSGNLIPAPSVPVFPRGTRHRRRHRNRTEYD